MNWKNRRHSHFYLYHLNPFFRIFISHSHHPKAESKTKNRTMKLFLKYSSEKYTNLHPSHSKSKNSIYKTHPPLLHHHTTLLLCTIDYLTISTNPALKPSFLLPLFYYCRNEMNLKYFLLGPYLKSNYLLDKDQVKPFIISLFLIKIKKNYSKTFKIF